MDQVLRKSAQEVEIDHLLEEEFLCDPGFSLRFLDACGLPNPEFRTVTVTAEPSLDSGGFGDLLVEGRSGNSRIALLIEDKITAGPATRQAERYAAHAIQMHRQGWDRVWTILVAPAAYLGERRLYDATLDLETLATLLQSPDASRLAHRRGIIGRSLEKKATAGVMIPDERLHELKAQYLAFVADWCTREAISLQFPELRQSYYDGDSWIEPIRHPALPDHMVLRHRLWLSIKSPSGQVDLIAIRADDAERKRFVNHGPKGAVFSDYSNGKGIQASLLLPEMRQNTGFIPNIAEIACKHMQRLVHWYLAETG